MDSNVSILDQIIKNKKKEEVSNLDAILIIDSLFKELSDRERDILIRRHGLHSGRKETLEKIGKAHKLTRERVRQIETFGVKKLRELEHLSKYLDNLKKVISQLLESHGGLMEKEYLLDALTDFSSEGSNFKNYDKLIHKNYLNFLITKLLHDKFEVISKSKIFDIAYKLKYQDHNHLEEIASEFYEKISKDNNIYTTKELINLINTLKTYEKHKEKFKIEDDTINLGKVIKKNFEEEHIEIINSNKPIYTILRAIKRIKQNKFGHWGHERLAEIRPKTINDKIYLVLKNKKEPMHFVEIAETINKTGFDSKIANPATVHNELILDKRYVLVGRGLYGLTEWGFRRGTVIDVIEEILLEAKRPLSREEIIQGVLNKRLVKKATVILALMNKNKFDRAEGKYILKIQTL